MDKSKQSNPNPDEPDVVEVIEPGMLVSMNDADCTHEQLVPDPSEELGNAMMCANKRCNVVFINAIV